MHVPSAMLTGSVCPVTVALASAGLVGAAVSVARKKPAFHAVVKFALVSTLVFGLQMFNYPIFNGVSAHLLGGVLAASLLGVGGGVLSVALVIAVQAFFFGDGGTNLDAIGMNLLNMAVIGAGVGGLFRNWLVKRGHSVPLASGIAAAVAVEVVALALVVELALGATMTSGALGALLGLHLVAAAIEGVLTVVLLKAFAYEHSFEVSRRSTVAIGATAAICICLAYTPLRSELPDAFEWTVEKFALFAHPT